MQKVNDGGFFQAKERAVGSIRWTTIFFLWHYDRKRMQYKGGELIFFTPRFKGRVQVLY